MIENPVGKFSEHMGKPDFTFQPWQFGDLYSKLTCLWTGNGFIMPEPVHQTKPEGVLQSIWLMPPSPERSDLRSETPMGFARAVFEANSGAANQLRHNKALHADALTGAGELSVVLQRAALLYAILGCVIQ